MIRQLPQKWLRNDALTALGIAVGGIMLSYLSAASGINFESDEAPSLALSSVLLAAPLTFYRKHPQVVLGLCTVLYIVFVYTLGVEYNSAQVAIYLSFYAVGAWSSNRRSAFWVRLIVSAVMGIWLLVEFIRGFTDPTFGEVGVTAYLSIISTQLLVNVVFFGAGWFFGERAWTQALERIELEQAHQEIQQQQSVISDYAVEAERLRIARELHDVVAHHVTVMGIQAAAARRLIPTDSEAATDQLQGVEESSREAVQELKHMVHTLRSSDEEYGPPPTLEQIPELIEQARVAGQHVDYHQIGERHRLNTAVELVLYRVAQEALTNARKHAGPTAKVQVRLRFSDEGVELDVSDDGRGQSAGSGASAPGTGSGVAGMKERMQSVGGTLVAENKSQGGWLVRAWVPQR